MRVEGTDDFKRAAQALTGLGDRGVRLATQKGLRASAKPLGEDMVRGGAADMPHRGGLSARVAASQVRVLASLTGGNPRVVISLRTREGYRLKAMDQGNLRHPVFAREGRKTTWVRQTVPAGGFSDAFAAGAPMVRRDLTRQVQQALDAAARTV